MKYGRAINSWLKLNKRTVRRLFSMVYLIKAEFRRCIFGFPKKESIMAMLQSVHALGT